MEVIIDTPVVEVTTQEAPATVVEETVITEVIIEEAPATVVEETLVTEVITEELVDEATVILQESEALINDPNSGLTEEEIQAYEKSVA